MSAEMNSNPPAQPPILQHYVCKRCGALCDPGRKRCWMCQADARYLQQVDQNPFAASLPAEEPPVVPATPTSSKYDPIFTVLLIGCLIVAILIGIGMAAEDPGALVGYLILIGPAFVVTGVRGLWQYGTTGAMQPGRLLVNLFVSFAVTVAIIAVLAVAAIALLFFLCLSEIT